MTIHLPLGLPAAAALAAEGFPVGQGAPVHADTLRIALINLMPDKPSTERQIGRMLAASGRHVELTLVVPGSYRPGHTPAAYLQTFYCRFPDIRRQHFDGVIVTGAPVETLPFDKVAYWDELREMLDWAIAGARSTLCICWAGMAALHHLYGTPKQTLRAKAFGVFPQVVEMADPLLAGLDGGFAVPVSRHAEVRRQDLPPGVEVLAAGAATGLCLLRDRANRLVCQFNHPEYDADTLMREYLRDRAAGRRIAPPVDRAFPARTDAPAPDAPAQPHWRPAAVALYANWLSAIAADRDMAATAAVTGLMRRSGPAGTAEIRLEPAGQDDAFTVNRMVEACGRSGVVPVFVRRDRGDRAVTAILAALPEPEAERLVRRLLAAVHACRVVYRALDGTVGVLAVRPGFAGRGSALGSRPSAERDQRAFLPAGQAAA